MQRIGTRFVRLQPELPGQGLGLASVHAVVALHGGSVVPVKALGLTARHTTQGHRFEALVSPVVLKDADYDIWSEIRPKVEEAFGKALDEAVLFGINTPSSWGSSIKSLASTASNTVTIGTGVDIAADMNNALAAVEADGYGPNAIAMRQDLRVKFLKLEQSNVEIKQLNEELRRQIEQRSRRLLDLYLPSSGTPQRPTTSMVSARQRRS